LLIVICAERKTTLWTTPGRRGPGGWAIERTYTRYYLWMANIPSIELGDGSWIPQLGFGVFQIDPAETAEAVERALAIGYRHIDTAEMYRNERGVGEGIRSSGIDRGQVYITSKLNNGFHEPADARRAFAMTLSELGFDHVDLFLIHWPLPTLYDGDFVSTWKVLEEFKAEGRARSIGVSNFQVDHLQRLIDECDVIPAVNQIELHPYFQNAEVAAFGEQQGIATEAWSPIAQGDVLDDAELGAIAGALGRSVAQVVLRWHIQRGYIVFPKSATPERIEENFQIFDFELDAEQMARIDALDRGEDGRRGPHPDKFAYVPGR
jgi:2,5-diketo-D-gluconate reductase A